MLRRLKESADAKEIKTVYYKMSRQYHPVRSQAHCVHDASDAHIGWAELMSARCMLPCIQMPENCLFKITDYFSCFPWQDKNKDAGAPAKFQRYAKAYEVSASLFWSSSDTGSAL